MVWEYVVAFQLLCGGFAAFLAAGKRRSWPLWFALGLLIPILGVALAWWIPEKRGERRSSAREGLRPKKCPPTRCVGHYIADCAGCPYFLKPLFDPSYSGPRKGYCTLFARDLLEGQGAPGGRLT